MKGKINWRIGLWWAGLALAALLLATSPALAQSTITLDSLFGDWAGQANVTDPVGDAQNNKTDLTAFYWATNPNEETAYFMAERVEGSNAPAITLWLRIDTNNNGSYDDTGDRIVQVDYDPRNDDSTVDVSLYDGTGAFLSTIASGADWGESKNEGGQRVEWGVSFASLGIAPFQTINMQLVSMQGGGVSDSVAEVQWSPANALGWPLLILLLVAGVIFLFYQRQRLGRKK
ncbi:MAG: hypothetical protein KKA73_07935 [Chloroflexi bacterium]|nr:hypothetical protein [Chloroflexota bacterium]MBU1747603.1 hypothetical protein [Chloroflexota bacterium]MBU1879656.1 hypothetical protein [Chloroflexota bacterium]